jgi:hypothetical protein
MRLRVPARPFPQGTWTRHCAMLPRATGRIDATFMPTVEAAPSEPVM